jgi:uncharacterized protein (TIRG00374 family)
MTETKPSFNRWVPVSATVGVVTFLVYTYYSAGFTSVISVIGSINPSIYAATFMFITLSVTCNSLAWRSLLSRLDIKVNAKRTFTLTWVGFFIDAMIPGGWSGDLFKAYLLSKESEIDAGRSGASIVVQRILIMLVALISLVSGLVLLIINYRLHSEIVIPVVFLAGFLSLSIAIAILVSIKPTATRKFVQPFAHLIYLIRRKPWNAQSFQASAEKTLNTFHEGVKALTMKPRALVGPLLLYVFAWGSELLALFLVFNSVGYFVTVDKVLVVHAIGGTLEVQTAAFSSFAQIATSTLYIVLGIAPAISLTATLLMSVSSFWFKLLVSYIAFSCVVLSRCFCYACARVRRHENRMENACKDQTEEE